MKDYFKEDEYWKEHINKNLESDFWINDYNDYLSSGICLDLGCGIGQYSKWFMEHGYEVISSDNIYFEVVGEFDRSFVR